MDTLKNDGIDICHSIVNDIVSIHADKATYPTHGRKDPNDEDLLRTARVQLYAFSSEFLH